MIKTATEPIPRLAWLVRELAAALGVDRGHVYRLEQVGKIGPRPIRLGGSVRYSSDECRRWIDAGAPPRDEWEQMKKAETATSGRRRAASA